MTKFLSASFSLRVIMNYAIACPSRVKNRSITKQLSAVLNEYKALK